MLLLLAFGNFINYASAKIKDVEIKGYVTRVNSATSFEIDDYRITMEGKYDVELENVDDKAIKFDQAQHLRVGTLVKIKGKENTETLELSVKEIKIDLKQFRHLSKTVVLDATPSDISKNADGTWSGTVIADARRILISNTTNVKFKLNKSEEEEEKERKKQEEKEKSKDKKNDNAASKDQTVSESQVANTEQENPEKKLSNKSDDEGFEDDDDLNDLLVGAKPLLSLDDVRPGVYMTYKGVENLNGSVIASDVIFVKNEKTKQEKDLWKDLRLKEKEAKKANSFGTLKVGDTKYKVLPEKEVQEYISQLGNTLIPEYQKNLAEDDENKIPFKFTVVYEKGFNAGAYATGTVVIHHDVFNYLENEAQLAFLLSHEIAHATQEHTIRAFNKDKNKRKGIFIGKIFSYAMGYGLLFNILSLTEAAMVNGYARNQENQADRIGMSNMIAHNYDPREAARVWKVVSLYEGNMPTNFFWSDHSSNAERRSFLMLTLRNTYADVDYSKLKKDSDEFHQIADIAKQKYPRKKKG
jgi:Zn-dependent protease with chaperone function